MGNNHTVSCVGNGSSLYIRYEVMLSHAEPEKI